MMLYWTGILRWTQMSHYIIPEANKYNRDNDDDNIRREDLTRVNMDVRAHR